VVKFAGTKATTFISHQWLASQEPDPGGVHFKAICDACDELCRHKNVAPEDMYLWVDYSSIPQVNSKLKLLSISSIGMYASTACYFLIVCPPAVHSDSNAAVGPETYQRRGWCRLEQWARMTVGGLQNMYIYDGALHPISDSMAWYHDSISVMDGDFTDPNDRGKLVDTILGLWSIAVSHRGEADNAMIFDLVQQHREQVFPKKYFGDLVEMMEGIMSSKNVGHEGSTVSVTRVGTLFRLFKAASGNMDKDRPVSRRSSLLSSLRGATRANSRSASPATSRSASPTDTNMEQRKDLEEQREEDRDDMTNYQTTTSHLIIRPP